MHIDSFHPVDHNLIQLLLYSYHRSPVEGVEELHQQIVTEDNNGDLQVLPVLMTAGLPVLHVLINQESRLLDGLC